MTDVRLNEKTGTGYERRHFFRLLSLDRLVMIAVDDQHGNPYRSQLIFGPVWLRIPHLGNLSDERAVFVRRSGELLVLAARSLDKASKRRVLQHVLFHAAGIIVCRKSEHSRQSIWVMHGEVKRQDAAVAPSDDRRLR